MYKFLVKLAFIIMGIYILFQIPFFKDIGESIKASIFEKAQNVANEVNRINDKIDGVKEKINQTEQKVVEITDTVNKTKEGVANTLTTAKEAIDSVQSAFTTEEEVDEPTEPQSADAEPTAPAPVTK